MWAGSSSQASAVLPSDGQTEEATIDPTTLDSNRPVWVYNGPVLVPPRDTRLPNDARVFTMNGTPVATPAEVWRAFRDVRKRAQPLIITYKHVQHTCVVVGAVPGRPLQN